MSDQGGIGPPDYGYQANQRANLASSQTVNPHANEMYTFEAPAVLQPKVYVISQAHDVLTSRPIESLEFLQAENSLLKVILKAVAIRVSTADQGDQLIKDINDLVHRVITN